jgi:hypothetical protein
MATVFEVMSALTDREKIAAQMKSRSKFDGLNKLKKKSLTLLGIEPSTIWLVASRLHYLYFLSPSCILFLI